MPSKLAERAQDVQPRMTAATGQERTLFAFADPSLAGGILDSRAGTDYRRFASCFPRSPLRNDAVVLAAIASLPREKYGAASSILAKMPANLLALRIPGYASIRPGDVPATFAYLRGLESGDPARSLQAGLPMALFPS